jgi:hypothetical protein
MVEWVKDRKLDAKVAKLLGWKGLVIHKVGDSQQGEGWITVFGNKPDYMTWERFWRLGQATSGKNEKHHIPNYSTVISDAMDVLNLFEYASIHKFGNQYRVHINDASASSENLAQAICLAALEAH